MESCVWLGRGRPSNWVVREKDFLLSPEQVHSLEQLIRQRLRLDIATIRGMNPRQWPPISQQIYADVMSYGKPARIDSFDGNYTLNRGLAAALLALALLSLAYSETDWRVTMGVLPIALLYGYRLYPFWLSHARQPYSQFLLLPAQPPPPKRPTNITPLPVSARPLIPA